MGDDIKTDDVKTEQVKTFTQEELNNIISERLQKERSSWIKELGVEDVKSAKDAVKKIKEIEDANKSEAEKLKAELDEMKNNYSKAEMKNLLIMSNVNPEKIERALKIAGSYDGELSEKVQSFITENPEFLKVNEPAKADVPASIGGTVNKTAQSNDDEIRNQIRKAAGLI